MAMYNRSTGRKAFKNPADDDLPSYIYRPQRASAPLQQPPSRYHEGVHEEEDVQQQQQPVGRLPRPPPGRQIEDDAEPVEAETRTRDSAFTGKKRGRFQYSPPRARRDVGVSFAPPPLAAAAGGDERFIHVRDDRNEKRAEEEEQEKRIRAVPKLSDDRVDKTVHWKNVHGIKLEEVAVLDKAVRARRFKPGDDILERVKFTMEKVRNEQNFSTRQLATHLYKGGMKSIWIAGAGQGRNGTLITEFFYGIESGYLDVMKRRYERPALLQVGVFDMGKALEQLPDDDHPVPPAEEEN